MHCVMSTESMNIHERYKGEQFGRGGRATKRMSMVFLLLFVSLRSALLMSYSAPFFSDSLVAP